MATKRRGRQRPGERPRAATARPTGRTAVLFLLVVLAGLWSYANSFDGVLVMDDVRAIAQNRTIRTLWPLATPLSPPTASTVSGRPVANFSFAVNYALAPADARDTFQPSRGGQPPDATARFLRNVRGYHLFNVLIHLAVALTLAGVIRRTLASPALGPRFARHSAAIATAAALVWVTHPLNTSAVTYLVQRVESLASLFYLLTLYCAIRAWTGGRRAAWTAGAVASCALGMGSKELMVTAPIVVALWGWLFAEPGERGPGEPQPARRWPLVAGLASTWAILAVLVFGEHRAPSLDLAWGSTWRYLLTQSEVITHYLRLVAAPSPLVFLYTWPLQSSLAAVWWQASLLAGLVALTLFGVVRRHPLAFAGGWFFLILAPSSSLLPIVTEVAAEHRMYLPLAAPIACAAVGLYAAARLLRQRWPFVDRHLSSWAGWVVGGAILVAVVTVLGSATRARNTDYRSDLRLWADTVAKQPANQRARVAYGSVLASSGKLADAEAEFREAVALDPDDPLAKGRLGSILLAKGDSAGAIPLLEYAVSRRPDDPDMHRFLGQAYAARGDERRAVAELGRAAAILGDNPQLLARIAAILAGASDPAVRNGPRAVALAERAVAATGRRDPMMLNILSAALASVGRFGEAAAAASEALPLAGAQGNSALAAELERRVSVYRARAGFPAR